MDILQCENVSKAYPKNSFQLHIDDFHISEGEVAVLLGPNGSGKTTFIKSIIDLIQLDEGSIHISGIDKKVKDSREQLSFLPEQFSFPQRYTVREALFYYAAIARKDYKEIRQQIDQIASLFDVSYLERKMKDLSKGMTQIVGLMYTFLTPKRLYIMDEPFNGLDAVQKENILDTIKEKIVKENAAALITTHTLANIEEIYSKVSLIKKGEIIGKKNREEVTRKFGNLEAYYLSQFRN